MKRLIRFCLNHIPRPVLQRIAGWAVPVVGLLYSCLLYTSDAADD